MKSARVKKDLLEFLLGASESEGFALYNDEVERGIQRLAQKTGLSPEEIRSMITKKMEEMQGLLKPDGALYIVAAELGAEIGPSFEEEGAEITIDKLVPGMRHVHIKGRIVRMYGPIQYRRRDGTEGERAEFKLSDGTGVVDVVIWSKSLISMIKEGKIKEGDVIEIDGARTSLRLGRLALNLDSSGSMIKVVEGTFPEFPEPEFEVFEVSDLGPDFNEVDVRGVVSRIFPVREFTREDGTKGFMSGLILKDRNTDDEIRAVLWGAASELINDLNVGDLLLIKAARVKPSRDGWIELHLDTRSKIIVEKRSAEAAFLPDEIVGRILYAFRPVRYKSRDGMVTSRDCIIEVDGKLRLCRLWEPRSQEIDGVRLPALVKLEHPYVRREGFREIINVGKLGKCLILEENYGEIPKDMERIARKIKYPRVWLDESGEGFREVRGTVIRVDPSASISWWCKKCRQRVSKEFGRFICENCGEVKEAEPVLAFSIYIDDSTGVLRASFFREVAERVIGKNVQEILEEIEEKGYEEDTYMLEELESKLLGKSVILRGRISYVEERGMWRMVVDEMEFAKPLEEAALLENDLETKYLMEIRKRLSS
ncbi:MAG: hypothetical protein DRO05_03490 [Thermoproteota archaeon]|nr:MAG: hypothetical protein DRO05_03490 [Candidatus Korarchaeota archaeon]